MPIFPQILIWNQIILCSRLGTFIDFQPVLDHFAQIYMLFQIFLAELSGISGCAFDSEKFKLLIFFLLAYFVSKFFLWTCLSNYTWKDMTDTIETLQFLCLNERDVNLIPISAVIWSCGGFAVGPHLAQEMMHFVTASSSPHCHKVVLCCFIYGAIIE